MNDAVYSFQSGAQIALKLLNSTTASGQLDSANRSASSSTTSTTSTAALDGALQSSGTKIVLSAKAAVDYFGPGSYIARSISGLGDTVEVQTSGLDIPQDKDAFRQQVLDFLSSDEAGYDARYPEHAEFLQALKDGKVVVKTVDETPELNWQPDVGWAVYRDGYPQGGGITSEPIGNPSVLAAWGVTQGQNVGQIGGHYFYAYFER